MEKGQNQSSFLFPRVLMAPTLTWRHSKKIRMIELSTSDPHRNMPICQKQFNCKVKK